ncbi:YbaB/EbfC family nucleoid-associated protein [Solwaraspora sp. WMMD1047]|uniref:YbaB/EbfC family nucleoid-associated protein n=1 Tax=Solwaraspora sp. WMMD1047 TaxID=3016102 RepID=UPI002415B192|nr:YbaB/EbfC family nucleoid-associated protein [Solwaraspora sp. WMMD1047]MDG4829504.1 YbaB/EbfC family nucleoid-associated protein [Solwaraspora sp. WMMD1047]
MQPQNTDPRQLEAAMNDLLEQVRASTERVDELNRSLATREITGYAGNGEVTVRLLGNGRFTEVVIDPDALRRFGAEDVGALVLEAVNDGLRRMQEANQAAYAPLMAESGEG